MRTNVKQLASLIVFGWALALLCLAAGPVRACTIFVLTDANTTLFFNNEDWSNPKSRIWFVPASMGRYGCVFVGFDSGLSEGGMNTKGLAYDVVAGYQEEWKVDPKLEVKGHSPRQMLETCATVDETIQFYRTHQESGFFRVKMLVADATGASVIIGASHGKLQCEVSHQCRGFGYGGRILDRMLAASPEPTVANGAEILRACLQKGQYATKYSNVFDLRSGDILLFRFPEKTNAVKLNLTAELKKGRHSYDMPQIERELRLTLK